MNPAYRHARFRADLPHGGLPESFTVITACNPEGRTASAAENAQRSEDFRQQLILLGLDHFPVTGYDATSPHEEAGFGIVCDEATACRLGDELRQEAIFQITRGEVSLVHLRSGDTLVPLEKRRQECRLSLGAWSTMADGTAAHPSFHFRGPIALLAAPATAFLCSTACPGDKILEAYDWANRQCDQGGTVISGFHTPVEKDVLAILARRSANIVLVPARDLPKTTPKELQAAAEEGRLLVLTPFDYGTQPRATQASCSLRNRFVLRHAKDRYIPHVAAGSSLAEDLSNIPIL
jgi:hypothetical protein